MSCCYQDGEILVFPSENGPYEMYGRADSETGEPPLPPLMYSFDDFVRGAPGDDVSDDERAMVHKLRARPFVMAVDESEVDSWIELLNRREDVAVASRNWRVSLASPVEGLWGQQLGQASIHEFLDRHGLEPFQILGSEQPVKVGIIDSGVDPSIVRLTPGLDDSQIDVVALSRCLRTNPHDPDGHGSAVAGIVHAIAPTAALTSIRCFGRSGSSIADVLFGLLFGRLLREPIDIFNLSFSIDVAVEACPACGHQLSAVDGPRQIEQVFAHLSAALDDRPIFVAAGGREARLATPARLVDVIAVGSIGGSDYDAPTADPAYEEIAEPFILGPGGSEGSPAARTHRGTRTFFGTSFSTAVVTGIVAQLLADRQSNGLSPARDERRRSDVVRLLREHAWTGFIGYDEHDHGMGVVRSGRSSGTLTW